MTFFKRALGAAAVTAMLASSTLAAEMTPLPAGKPAGTRQANLMSAGPIFWIGLAALAAGIAFAVSNNGNTPTTPTTSTTGTGV